MNSAGAAHRAAIERYVGELGSSEQGPLGEPRYEDDDWEAKLAVVAEERVHAEVFRRLLHTLRPDLYPDGAPRFLRWGAGDELALIPPVSGGATALTHARVTSEPLSLDALAARVRDPRAGAGVTFSGVLKTRTLTLPTPA